MRTHLLVSTLFALNTAAQTIEARYVPHLIVPVRKDQPDQNYGTQNSAQVEHLVHTMFSFDAQNTAANRCTIAFELNTNASLWSPWKLWGVAPFTFNVSHIDPTMNKDKDTWNDRPAVGDWVATIEIGHDGVHQITSNDVPCVKGDVDQYLVQPADAERDFGLTWYQVLDPYHGLFLDHYVE